MLCNALFGQILINNIPLRENIWKPIEKNNYVTTHYPVKDINTQTSFINIHLHYIEYNQVSLYLLYFCT